MEMEYGLGGLPLAVGASPGADKIKQVMGDLRHVASVLACSFPGETPAARNARVALAELLTTDLDLLARALEDLLAGAGGDDEHSPRAATGDGRSPVGAPAAAATGCGSRPAETRALFGYRVEITTSRSSRRTSTGRFTGPGTITLELASGLSAAERERHIDRLVRRLVASRRLPALRERIYRIARERFAEFGLRIGQIRFREQNRRWGSCSSRGNINLSYRLLDAPDELVEYVCIHELAHLIEFNHSPRFWALVERADPDYRIHREQLRQLEQGRQLPAAGNR